MAQPKKAARKQPQKQPGSEIAARESDDVSSLDAEFVGMSSMGLEDVTAKDLVFPRISILQKLSPELERGSSKYNSEAREGNIAAIGMPGEYLWNELQFLPVVFRKNWLEWAPRESGRGLVAMHPTDKILESCTTRDGNIVQEASQFFGFVLNTGKPLACFIPMTTTQIKKARMWLTLATSEEARREDGTPFVPPLFYRVYRLGSQPESNAKGSWYGWTVNRGPRLAEYCDEHGMSLNKMVLLAKGFHRSLSEADRVRSMESE